MKSDQYMKESENFKKPDFFFNVVFVVGEKKYYFLIILIFESLTFLEKLL